MKSEAKVESLHFIIVETKDVKGDYNLREEEKRKIKHAEQFFQGKANIEFKTQFTNRAIYDVLKEIRPEIRYSEREQ